VVRELTKAEQARGALVGTPGSMHARHSSKPAKQYGPGFFGSRSWKWAFYLGTLLTIAAFVGYIAWNEAQHAQTVDEHEQDPGTETPGTDNTEESRDNSGTALGGLVGSMSVRVA
jgi:hypothetical protein